MIRGARNILTNGTIYGLLVTSVVLAMQRAGALETLEQWCYDRRVQYFQFFNPPPTDRLVHLDIDDAVLDALGAWPWPRSKLAEMIDEIAAAKPRAVAMDILFSEEQDIRWAPQGDGKFTAIDNDAEFAAAIKRAGCVLIGTSLPIVPPAPPNPVHDAMRLALEENLELDIPSLTRMLRERGVGGSELEQRVAQELISARREAMYACIHRRLEHKFHSEPELRRILLKQSDENQRGAAVHALEEEYPHALADIAVARFSLPRPAGLPPLLEAEEQLAPIPALSYAAASAAFFDYPPEAGGAVRRVPLFMEHGGRIYPHISIELAAMELGARFDEFRFTDDSVTIPRHIGEGGDLVVPVYTIQSLTLHRSVPMMFDVPFFGGAQWETMYDKVGGAHLPLNVVWDICQTRHQIELNSRQVDDAMRLLLAEYDPKQLEAFNKNPLPPGDVASRQRLLRNALTEYNDFFATADSVKLEEIKDPVEREATAKLRATGRAFRLALENYPKLQRELENQRNRLRGRLRDKAVLIGWTATSAVADVVPTPIHAKCPGVVIHGAIVNAMLTGHFWRRAPVWVDGLATALAGFVATFLASRLPPTRAIAYALLLGAGYAVFNGLVLFDRGNRIISLAGPLVAITLTWAGCTLLRLLVESWERTRIRRRFSSYVDPSLVSYVEEHPEAEGLEGQVRELSVVFTDLEGFTRLTELYGEKTVGLLNEFMGMAVPIIRSNGGLVNKFLGDGIMFFFGAPREQPDHAARAISTVLDLRHGMRRLNESFESRGFPHLTLRAGISTGNMVVGDAGYVDAQDYTVLGSCVNLGARLESANKQVGTACLATERSIQLGGGKFLVRPIGKLCVVGIQSGRMTFEPMNRLEHATPNQRRLADLTRDMVECYMAGNFVECQRAIDRLEQECGPTRLTALYRNQCQISASLPPGQPFDCQIVLSEK